jgi:hypothetical protein
MKDDGLLARMMAVQSRLLAAGAALQRWRWATA